MKSIPKFFALMGLGSVSFLFFLYLSFPYEILKEAIAAEISESTGQSISIGKMGPKFPLGLYAEKVRIVSANGNKVELGQLGGKIKILPFFLGKLGFFIESRDKTNGYLEIDSSLSLLDLVTGQVVAPSSLSIEAADFSLDELISYALDEKATSADTNIMLKPLFESFELQGKLNANVDLSIDSVDLSKSEGKAEFSLKNSSLIITDKSLSIPNQLFSKAFVKARFNNGQLRFDPSSGIDSDDLSIKIAGQIIQKPRFERSNLDLMLTFEFRKALKDQFGWIMDAVAEKTTEGKMEIHVTGSIVPGPQIKIL